MSKAGKHQFYLDPVITGTNHPCHLATIDSIRFPVDIFEAVAHAMLIANKSENNSHSVLLRFSGSCTHTHTHAFHRRVPIEFTFCVRLLPMSLYFHLLQISRYGIITVDENSVLKYRNARLKSC